MARQEFAAKLLGTQQATEETVAVRTAAGRRVQVDISSTQLLQQGRSSASSGSPIRPASRRGRTTTSSVQLTPRQLDVLRYVAAGHSTEHIAKTLGISTETVRNHVRGLMGRLGAHYAPRGCDPRATSSGSSRAYVRRGRVCCSMPVA